MDESFQYHLRALAQYRTTLGEGHARTAAACYRLADHYIRLRLFEDAGYVTTDSRVCLTLTEDRKMLKQANKVYSARKCTVNELARTIYKQGQLFDAQGDGEEAQRCWSDAYEKRFLITQHDKRPVSEIGEADYDKLIIFWNR